MLFYFSLKDTVTVGRVDIDNLAIPPNVPSDVQETFKSYVEIRMRSVYIAQPMVNEQKHSMIKADGKTSCMNEVGFM